MALAWLGRTIQSLPPDLAMELGVLHRRAATVTVPLETAEVASVTSSGRTAKERAEGTSHHQTSVGRLFDRAITLFNKGRYEEAIVLFEQVIIQEREAGG